VEHPAACRCCHRLQHKDRDRAGTSCCGLQAIATPGSCTAGSMQMLSSSAVATTH
jgi:hypothetical protein